MEEGKITTYGAKLDTLYGFHSNCQVYVEKAANAYFGRKQRPNCYGQIKEYENTLKFNNY